DSLHGRRKRRGYVALHYEWSDRRYPGWHWRGDTCGVTASTTPGEETQAQDRDDMKAAGHRQHLGRDNTMNNNV
ncbi:MAG: hypothetical protein ABI743_15010, partial [bacterium]